MVATTEFATIKKDVLDKISPNTQEKNKLQNTAELLKNNVEKTAHNMKLNGVTAKLVGSAARNTWISGTHDLDIFIMFPLTTTREELKQWGLGIAKKIAENSEYFEERYAEHPYINMKYNGFDVDIVPCFKVQSASDIRSAVDRTPFHNEYIKTNIKGLENEVLVLKQFMKGIKVYGSELKNMGFSGYLTELLVIHYGSFENIIKSACKWEPGKYIDIKSHGNVIHEEPLIVIDPTDPKRNVAAALSLDKFCIFISKCRQFIEKPDLDFFFPQFINSVIDIKKTKEYLISRKTVFLAIVFEKPDLVDDILYPQLYKMQHSVNLLLKNYDFEVINSKCWSGKETGLLLELISDNLPVLKKHHGPPVWVCDHAEDFRKKYENMPDTFSFYIENGIYIAEIPRQYSNVYNLIKEKITTCALGKNISISVKKGFRLYKNMDIFNIYDSDLTDLLKVWPDKL